MCLANPCLEESEPCSLCSDMILNQPKIMKRPPLTSGLNISKIVRFRCTLRASYSITCLSACLDEDRPED